MNLVRSQPLSRDEVEELYAFIRDLRKGGRSNEESRPTTG
jgi:hypothetical protein